MLTRVRVKAATPPPTVAVRTKTIAIVETSWRSTFSLHNDARVLVKPHDFRIIQAYGLSAEGGTGETRSGKEEQLGNLDKPVVPGKAIAET